MPGRLVQAFSFCYDRDHVMDVTGAQTMEWVSQSTDIQSCFSILSSIWKHELFSSLSEQRVAFVDPETIFIFCRLFKCRMEADFGG